MKNWQVALAVLGGLAAVNGLFWAAMAIAADDGLKKLDLHWFGPAGKAGEGAAAQLTEEEGAQLPEEAAPAEA